MLIELCGGSKAHGLKHFFYGGGEGVAERLAQRLGDRFPGLIVAGTYTPPIGRCRRTNVRPSSRQSRPLARTSSGSGWVPRNRSAGWPSSRPGFNVPVLIGIGAAFDFHAGIKPQAPRWMQRGGLEWLFRLATEPRRLWRRYIVLVGLFSYLITRQLLLDRIGI